METIFGFILFGCLACLVPCALVIVWVFRPSIYSKLQEPFISALSVARLTGIGATLFATFYGTYYDPDTGLLCSLAGCKSGIVNGFPVPWWGLQTAGLALYGTPVVLALDILFWGLIAFLILIPLRVFGLRFLPASVQFRAMLLGAGVLCLLPTAIPYVNSKFDTNVNLDAHFRQDASIARSALQFVRCHDYLVNSTVSPKNHDVMLELGLRVNYAAVYRMQVSGPFNTNYFSDTLEVGDHTLLFRFSPTSPNANSYWEQRYDPNGPYEIDAEVEEIDKIRGQRFGVTEMARAMAFGFLPYDGMRYKCKTNAYQVTDFGPLPHIFPRTPTPVRIPTP